MFVVGILIWWWCVYGVVGIFGIFVIWGLEFDIDVVFWDMKFFGLVGVVYGEFFVVCKKKVELILC